MAKISARGATKLAEGYYELVDPTGAAGFLGDTLRVWLVLRSDGTILVASAYPNAETQYDRSRGSYTVHAKLKNGADVEVFRGYVEKIAARRGVTAVFK